MENVRLLLADTRSARKFKQWLKASGWEFDNDCGCSKGEYTMHLYTDVARFDTESTGMVTKYIQETLKAEFTERAEQARNSASQLPAEPEPLDPDTALAAVESVATKQSGTPFQVDRID